MPWKLLKARRLEWYEIWLVYDRAVERRTDVVRPPGFEPGTPGVAGLLKRSKTIGDLSGRTAPT